MPSRPLTIRDVASLEKLEAAWHIVYRNDAADGELTRGVLRFAENTKERLEELANDLREGEYCPSPLQRVDIPKSDGGYRTLHIPTVRDRIIERALADLISLRLDRWLSPWSFAYRSGYGVRDAAAQLVAARQSGARVVIRCDITDCFDSIDRGRLLSVLDDRLASPEIVSLVDQLLERPRSEGHTLQRSARGAPQGGPLSPLLCNLYLDQVDLDMARRGFPTIRYADDLAIACKSPIDAWEALMAIEETLNSIGLELGDEKTHVTTFDEGFAFLGEDFTPTHPPDDPLLRVREPDARVLYVQAEGSTVRTSKGQVIVSKKGDDALSVPSRQVGAIVCIGSANLSTGMRSLALRQEIDVVFLSRRGRFEGWLQGAKLPNARTRRLQYQRGDDDGFRLALARQFVVGKMANQRSLLLRYLRRERSAPLVDAADALERLARRAARSVDLDELLGYEGTGARRYFEAFGSLLPNWAEWNGRNRQPPLDPVNAALSFAYALLTAEAVAASATAGLDPAAGFLHRDDGNRPSLALDLMEEFRPLIAESVVVDLVRRNRLQPNHFRSENDRGAVFLTEKGKKALIGRFEERMLTVTTHLPTRKKVSYRRSMYLQAARVSACIKSGQATYESMSWR